LFPPQGFYANTAIVLDRNNTQLDIAGTIAETTIYSKTIPANTLGTSKVLRCTLDCDYLNNSSNTRTIIIKVKYGATTMWQDTTNTIAVDVSRHALTIDFRLASAGATNSQVLTGKATMSDPGGATAGFGDFADDEIMTDTNFAGTAAEDSTADKTLDITVTHSSTEANISLRRNLALLELI
jgi:hypothetical protein